jgi:hypothetical protein
MSFRLRFVAAGAALLLVLAAPALVTAQGNPEPHSFKFNSGQNVQPVFEGWAKNPDGSFNMYFGYFNRNYVETPIVPVGNDNKFEPGAADRGQPTFFNTRIRRSQFSVTVPKDWGKKELTWSVTVHGSTEKAVAWLQPEWEIDPVYGGRTVTDEMKKNKAPTIALDAPATIAMPNSLTITANVQDDGLPVPQKRPRQAAIGQETPPALKPLPDQPEIPVNVPSIGGGARGGGGGRGGQQGPVVTWTLWRAPAIAQLSAATTPVRDGKATLTASFSRPGTYVFRARVSDGELNTEKEATVTVNAAR